MKNILFVCPPPCRDGKRIHPRSYPTLLLTVAALLEEKGFSPQILDGFLYNMRFPQIVDAVGNRQPDLVFVVPYDYSREVPLDLSADLADSLKKSFPEIPVGLNWSYNEPVFLRCLREHEQLDFAVLGEPELTTLELCERLQHSGDMASLEGVQGIAFRREAAQRVEVNEPRPLIEDLDILPYPARHLIPLFDYPFIPHTYRKPKFVIVLTSRGCPYNCLFCLHDFYPHSYRVRSVPNVMGELIGLRKTYGIGEIHFEDPIFGMHPDWLRDFCHAMIRDLPEVQWTCLMRIDTVQTSLLPLMKKAGCASILFGIEAGEQALLDYNRKRITMEKTRQVVNMVKRNKIEFTASFLLGMPGETPEGARKTIDFAIELDPDYIQVFLTKVYEKSQVPLNDGKCLDWDNSAYDIRGPVFLPKAYSSPQQLKKLQREAYRRFYLRPTYVLKHLRRIRSPKDIFRYVKGAAILLKLNRPKPE